MEPEPRPFLTPAQRNALPKDYARQNTGLALATDKQGKPLLEWNLWERMPDFPGEADAFGRLQFILKYLQARWAEQLLPGDARPSLLPYAGWVLNRVLKKLVRDPATGHAPKKQPGTYIYPEDTDKAIDAINLYLLLHDRQLTEDERMLDRFDDFEKRHAADAAFLQERGGNGEAVRVAQLENGTQIVQVNTPAAAHAYGSDVWLSEMRYAWHKGDVMIIIDLHGERWLVDFRRAVFQDATGQPLADVAKFLREQPGLAVALKPFLPAMFRHGLPPGKLLRLLASHPEWDSLVDANQLVAWACFDDRSVWDRKTNSQSDVRLNQNTLLGIRDNPVYGARLHAAGKLVPLFEGARWNSGVYLMQIVLQQPDGERLIPQGRDFDAIWFERYSQEFRELILLGARVPAVAMQMRAGKVKLGVADVLSRQLSDAPELLQAFVAVPHWQKSITPDDIKIWIKCAFLSDDRSDNFKPFMEALEKNFPSSFKKAAGLAGALVRAVERGTSPYEFLPAFAGDERKPPATDTYRTALLAKPGMAVKIGRALVVHEAKPGHIYANPIP